MIRSVGAGSDADFILYVVMFPDTNSQEQPRNNEAGGPLDEDLPVTATPKPISGWYDTDTSSIWQPGVRLVGGLEANLLPEFID